MNVDRIKLLSSCISFPYPNHFRLKSTTATSCDSRATPPPRYICGLHFQKYDLLCYPFALSVRTFFVFRNTRHIPPLPDVDNIVGIKPLLLQTPPRMSNRTFYSSFPNISLFSPPFHHLYSVFIVRCCDRWACTPPTIDTVYHFKACIVDNS